MRKGKKHEANKPTIYSASGAQILGPLPALLILSTASLYAQPYGLPTPREENSELIITELPTGEGTDSFPRVLSDMPALFAAGSGQGHTVSGVIPYAPAAPLWSDYAGKERYMALPGLGQAELTAEQGWNFPEGTVLIKNFSLPLDERDPGASEKRIETRLLVKLNSAWHGFTYEWNDEETDAALLEGEKTRSFEIIQEDGSTIDYDWLYPSRSDCMRCHTDAANGVLGVTTAQLNNEFAYPGSGTTANQLASLNHIGFFTEDAGDVEALPRLNDYRDENASLTDRAKSYLASNCAMCHQPGGGTPTMMDVRWSVPAEEMNVIDIHPMRYDFGITEPRIVAPGDPTRSVLWERMKSSNQIFRMPPLATSRLDDTGIAMIEEWINSLAQPPAHGGWQVY